MNTNWDKFIAKHNGVFLARNSFENFCFDILDIHYPGREIVSSNELEKSQEDNLNVIFLSKFFFDELSNSRKGQIRKAFKKFLDFKNKNNKKIYAWVFCVPYTLNNEEMKWWLTWKNKSSQKYSINIQFFDGDYCLQLSKKYDLYDKWFNTITVKENKNDEKEEKNPENENLFELIAEKKKEDTKTSQTITVNEEETKEIKDKKQFLFAEKITTKPKYEIYKKEYIRILEEVKNLSKEKISEIKENNSQENPFDFFNETEIETIDTLKLFYKAKSAEVRKKYIDALVYFETILAKKDYAKILKYKKSEIPKSVKKCQLKTEALLNELEGDIFAIKNEQIKALLCYEKAFKNNKKNDIIAEKYYLSLADKQKQSENYESAIQNYQKAININKDKKSILKQKNAYWLDKGDNFVKFYGFKFLNVFLSPLAYWQAHSLIPEESTKIKLKNSSKKFYLTLSLCFIILLSIFFISKIAKINRNTEPIVKTAKKSKITPLYPLNVDDVAISKGDIFMKKLSIKNIYLVDSAIREYRRAIAFDNKNEIAYNKLKYAQKYKNNYIQTAQVRILSQKDKYFISMRRVSEGLQLFKYIYDQKDISHGKYGYVDTLMNIVIPPIYDFDYNRMYKGTENFNSGIAFVCIKLSNNDTLFFNINKKNKIVKIFNH